MPASGSTYAAEQAVRSLESLLEEARADVQRIADSGLPGAAGGPAISRLNASVQDCLAAMKSRLRELELLAEEKESEEEGRALQERAQSLRAESDRLRASLRGANLQAKANAERTAKQERELLLAGGEDAALRRQALQTKAELASVSESVTESLRRTRQLMSQNLEHSAKTLGVMDVSHRTLNKADEEYRGQRSIFSVTKQLLSKLESHGILDRIILAIGFLFFISVCAYVVSKRLGISRLLKGEVRPVVVIPTMPDAPHTPRTQTPPLGVAPAIHDLDAQNGRIEPVDNINAPQRDAQNGRVEPVDKVNAQQHRVDLSKEGDHLHAKEASTQGVEGSEVPLEQPVNSVRQAHVGGEEL